MSGRELRSVVAIEDDPEIRDLLAMSLGEVGGLRCDAFADAEAALAAIAADPPDLVLVDWKMPGIGGAEVLSRLRADARTAGLPVVVLSGATLGREIEASGATATLAKPFDPIGLPEELAAVFRRS